MESAGTGGDCGPTVDPEAGAAGALLFAVMSGDEAGAAGALLFAVMSGD